MKNHFDDIRPMFAGMTFRQYAATKCLVGLLTDGSWIAENDIAIKEHLVKVAVVLADELIAELAKEVNQ